MDCRRPDHRVVGWALWLRVIWFTCKFGNISVALGVGLLVGAMPFGWVLFKRSKRLDSFQQGLPEALDLMVSALRAGTQSCRCDGLGGA